MPNFKNKSIVITGGTGSLGKTLIKRLLSDENNLPDRVLVLSRDEAKQYYMKEHYTGLKNTTEDILYHDSNDILKFSVCDVRNFVELRNAIKSYDIIINAAALKQVPTCEFFPSEAVKTNIGGAENIVKIVQGGGTEISTVVGVSTDKACKPINVMGMTKSIQERIFVSGGFNSDGERNGCDFVCVRYGNVLASRGSVIPFFLDRIKNDKNLPITSYEMTRFLMPLSKAVDTVFNAIEYASDFNGFTIIPHISSAKIRDVAEVLSGGTRLNTYETEIRPGEKLHEELFSCEESLRTKRMGNYYYMQPNIEDRVDRKKIGCGYECGNEFVNSNGYSSKDNNMNKGEIYKLSKSVGLLYEQYCENGYRVGDDVLG